MYIYIHTYIHRPKNTCFVCLHTEICICIQIFHLARADEAVCAFAEVTLESITLWQFKYLITNRKAVDAAVARKCTPETAPCVRTVSVHTCSGYAYIEFGANALPKLRHVCVPYVCVRTHRTYAYIYASP